MTLKCKIKEMSEMDTLDRAVFSIPNDDEGNWFDLEATEEQMEICELGTIEEISAKAIAARKERQKKISENQGRRDKERKFYDKGRMGNKAVGIAKKMAQDRDTRSYGIWNTKKQSGSKYEQYPEDAYYYGYHPYYDGYYYQQYYDYYARYQNYWSMP